MGILHHLRLGINRIGLDVSRLSDRTQLVYNYFNADIVLDVGANHGQFAQSIRKLGYQGDIVSFEPLIVAHDELMKNSNADNFWSVHPRCALGETNSFREIHVSKNSVSSSFLNMRPSHIEAAPDSVYDHEERVEIIKLDDVFDSYLGARQVAALKIDAQGYEEKVLEGSKKSLKSISIVQLEISLIPLYEDTRNLNWYLEYFANLGMHLWDVIPGFRHQDTGQLLQVDGIFVKDHLGCATTINKR
jgi:FkbM family methyltransferase